MARSILVPLDGSSFAEAALPTAVSLARRMDAAVCVVNVREPIPTLAPEQWESVTEAWSTAYLNDVERRLKDLGDVEVRSEVLEGDVAGAVSDHASATDADLLVMSTHGRGAASRFWLGSTADAVLRHVLVPVLLVRPPEDAPPDFTEDVSVRRLLVALDGSTHSESVLAPALMVARAWEADVTLLRIAPYPHEVVSVYLPDTIQMNVELFEGAKEAATIYLETARSRLLPEGVSVDTRMDVDTSAAAGILHALSDTGADMVAVATHGFGGLRRLVLGSVAYKVVRGAQTPVLVVRPQ